MLLGRQAISAREGVEHDAKAMGPARTDEHTRRRAARSRPIMDRLHAWLEERTNQYAPKSPMASAVG